MYLTIKQQLKHLSKEEYKVLLELSHAAKNLYNQALYNIRQYFFVEGEYLNYEKNYVLLKGSENYKLLNSNMAQQILKEADSAMKAFFGLLKLAKKGKYSYNACRLPSYLPKDGYATLIIGFVRLNGSSLVIPFSQGYKKLHNPVVIKMPPVLAGKKIKEIRIIPRSDARFFEIQYTYEAEYIQRNLNTNNALAIDLGINNLMTVVTSGGRSFIIDGRRLKSINQWYHKENVRLTSIKDRQHYGKKLTKAQSRLLSKRNRLVNDYMSKAASIVIKYCLQNDIGTLVVGYNETFQKNTNMGSKNNQSFLSIPYGKLRDKLQYLCELNGIAFVKQEESYTSKASFWDNDIIPVYNQDNPQPHIFSGTRLKRGLYRASDGRLLNADVNGALNILRKSNVVGLQALYSRGEVDTPVRIRVA